MRVLRFTLLLAALTAAFAQNLRCATETCGLLWRQHHDQRLYTTSPNVRGDALPKLNVTFVHSGWAATVSTGAAEGPSTSVSGARVPYKPTVMTVMLA